jgi:hypothetical protein
MALAREPQQRVGAAHATCHDDAHEHAGAGAGSAVVENAVIAARPERQQHCQRTHVRGARTNTDTASAAPLAVPRSLYGTAHGAST